MSDIDNFWFRFLCYVGKKDEIDSEVSERMKLIKKIGMVVLTTAVLGTGAFFVLSQSMGQNGTDQTSSIDASSIEESRKNVKEYSKGAEDEESEKKAEPIRLEKTTISLGAGESYTLKTIGSAVKWQADDTNIINVQNGTITANATGETNVVALDEDGNRAVCKVTVKAAPEWVKLAKTDLTLGVGETYDFKAILPKGAAAADRKFSSGDSSILEMTKTEWEGKVKAVKTGTTNVRVKLYNGQEATCRIVVKNEPTKVKLSSETVILGVGERFSLSAGIPKGSGAAGRTFSSADEKIVKTTKKDWRGEFKAEKEGDTTVSVRLYNGQEATCKVIVKKEPESIEMAKTTLTLKVGQKYVLGSNVNDGAAALGRTYTNSDDSVVKLTKNTWAAEFEAIAPGTTWIKVVTYNGLEATCQVTVEGTVKKTTTDTTTKKKQTTDDKKKAESDTPPTFQPGAPTGGHVTAADGTPWSAEAKSFSRTLVYADDTSVRLTNNVVSMYVGDKYNIDVDGVEDKKFYYVSADLGVATVDKFGTVTAVGVGTTDITIMNPKGIGKKLQVIVANADKEREYAQSDVTEVYLNSVYLYPVQTNYQEIDEMADQFIGEVVNDSMTYAERVKACYAHLVKECADDDSYFRTKAVSIEDYLSDEDREIAEFSYSLFRDRVGTSEHFAAAFTVIMRKFGYEANMVYGEVASGEGFEGHFWVDVEINGKHFIFDPDVEQYHLDENGEVTYSYFGMKPEDNEGVYRYRYKTCVSGFARG